MTTDVRVIVIAAGEGSRWGSHLGVPKHLVTIGGERLIDRTARLFAAYGDVLVVARDARYETPYSTLVAPRLNDRNYGADKFLSSAHLWSRDGRTIVAYGDVYFSDAAVETIATFADREWRLFARFGPSRIYGGDRGECFAQSFWPQHIGDHVAALRRIVNARRQRYIGEIGGWQHYRAFEGLFLDQHARGARYVEIDDETEDLDYPADLDRVRSVVEQTDSAT